MSMIDRIKSMIVAKYRWISIPIVAVPALTFLVIYKKLWFEGGLIFSLSIICAISTLALKDQPFYKSFTLPSISFHVSKVILFVLGMYVYDFGTDVQMIVTYVTQ